MQRTETDGCNKMKIRGLIICAVSFIALMTASVNAAAQDLSFSGTRIEAGEISEDEKPVYEYEFMNIGKRAVNIMKISTTCGSCLKAESDRKTVNPGEKGKITVSYFPKGHPGKFERRIFIFTDAVSSVPAAVLELAVSVKMGDDLTPYYPINMGSIRMKTDGITFRKGRREGICLEYLDMTGRDFKPKVTGEFLPPYLKVTVTSPSELAQDEDSVLEDSARGKVGEICISFDDEAFPNDREKVEIPVMLKGLGVGPAASTIKVIVK